MQMNCGMLNAVCVAYLSLWVILKLVEMILFLKQKSLVLISEELEVHLGICLEVIVWDLVFVVVKSPYRFMAA